METLGRWLLHPVVKFAHLDASSPELLMSWTTSQATSEFIPGPSFPVPTGKGLIYKGDFKQEPAR